MSKRTTKGLRDILFDEIDELRAGNGDPSKAQAVAQLARQILNTAKIEMDFLRTISSMKDDGKTLELGSLELGTESHALPARQTAPANLS